MNSQIYNNGSQQSAEIAHMQSIFNSQQEAYAVSPMPSLQERKRHLTLLKALLIEHKNAIAAAISADFTARSIDETLLAEIMPCVQSINYSLKHLRRWMKPSSRSVGLYFLPASARVVYQPLGVVGIIVPFNYPLNLAVMPLISALAAGNRAMLKMSEFTPETADLLKKILRKGFDENHVTVVTGEADIAAAFSKLPFDHLLFTGSTTVGKLVMRAAADNLTPVTLELGGKSPAIIADDIPMQDIIDRLCFAKSLNAGQTCVAPDYVLIPCNKLEPFIQLYKTAFRRMFPTINGNPHYTSMANACIHQRLQDWLKDAAGKGARIEKLSDESIDDGTFRMPLHIVTQVTEEMKIMQEELFGPILPVVPYDSIEEALAYVQKRPRPLALYLFTYVLPVCTQSRPHSLAMAGVTGRMQWANYGGGNACALSIAEDGKLGEATGFVQHAGKKKPLAHSINLDTNGRFAVVADAGLDKVFVYRFEGGKLKANDPPSFEAKPGAAPRHFAFHPDGKHAYVINESALSITAFDYDGKKGTLTEVQTIPTVPKGWKGGSTAEVVVHPSGKFVYGSNRGHDSIAVFAVDAMSGKLTHVENQAKGVKTPRNFAIDPSGKYCLVANQDSHSVIVFRVDPETGKLSPTGVKVEIDQPVCVRFLAWPR